MLCPHVISAPLLGDRHFGYKELSTGGPVFAFVDVPQIAAFLAPEEIDLRRVENVVKL
jgi:hypothetical protein